MPDWLYNAMNENLLGTVIVVGVVLFLAWTNRGLLLSLLTGAAAKVKRSPLAPMATASDSLEDALDLVESLARENRMDDAEAVLKVVRNIQTVPTVTPAPVTVEQSS